MSSILQLVIHWMEKSSRSVHRTENGVKKANEEVMWDQKETHKFQAW